MPARGMAGTLIHYGWLLGPFKILTVVCGVSRSPVTDTTLLCILFTHEIQLQHFLNS